MTRKKRKTAALTKADTRSVPVLRSLADFMENSPLADVLAEGDLDFGRARDPGRDLYL